MEIHLQKSKQKHLATLEDKNPNHKFINNEVLLQLKNNPHLKETIEKRKLNFWELDGEYVDIIFKDLMSSDLYKEYMSTKLSTYKEDKEFVKMYSHFSNTQEESSKLVLRLLIDKEKMLMYDIKMIDLYTQICINYNKYITCIFSDDNAHQLIMRIKLDISSPHIITLCNTEDHITILKAIEYNLIYNMLVKGVKGIKKVSLKSTRKLEYDIEENTFKDAIVVFLLEAFFNSSGVV